MPSCTWSIVAEPVSHSITSIMCSDIDFLLESRHTMFDLILPFIYFIIYCFLPLLSISIALRIIYLGLLFLPTSFFLLLKQGA